VRFFEKKHGLLLPLMVFKTFCPGDRNGILSVVPQQAGTSCQTLGLQSFLFVDQNDEFQIFLGAFGIKAFSRMLGSMAPSNFPGGRGGMLPLTFLNKAYTSCPVKSLRSWFCFKVLIISLLLFGIRSNPAREAFVEMCADTYVQKMTFDSYLYKTVVPGNPLDDIKLAINTIGSLVRANALRQAGKALAA
jgi:hypothetical protein